MSTPNKARLSPLRTVADSTNSVTLEIRRGANGYRATGTLFSPACLNSRLRLPPNEDDISTMLRYGALLGGTPQGRSHVPPSPAGGERRGVWERGDLSRMASRGQVLAVLGMAPSARGITVPLRGGSDETGANGFTRTAHLPHLAQLRVNPSVRVETTVSRPDHDARYHQLFSDPLVVAQLLREFVDGPWIADLDLENMVPLATKFHADTGQRREGDKIWRIPRRDGTDAYLVLLLEFQSTSDRYMALRVNTYASLLLQQLIIERRLMPNGELPPLLPVVLHNGDGQWRAPLALRELIGLPQGSPLWRYQPDMRYYLIDVGSFSKADLELRKGLPALWFRLENAHDLGELVLAANAVFALLSGHPEFSAARAVFIEFLGAALAPLGPEFRIPDNWLEVGNMLLTRTEQWKQEWLQEGRQLGEAALLLRQLERRFGELPDWIADRVNAADTDTLEEWGLRILDAASLEDVIADRPS